MTQSQWTTGAGNTEFIQFVTARVTRTPDGLGGYDYRATDNKTGLALYIGPIFESARLAAVTNPKAVT